MSFQSIQAGNRLDIKVQYRNIGDVVYTSRVLNVLDAKNQTVAITMPVRIDKILNMLPNKEYEVTAYIDQAMMVFKGFFEGYAKKDDDYFVALRLSAEGYKIQRREFFRFSCNISLTFTVIDFEEGDLAAEILHAAGMVDIHEGVAKDIGGGGLRFMSDSDLNLEHLIQTTVQLGDATLVTKGRILEKQYLPKAVLKYQYRVLFTDITKAQQEEIAKYIFVEQRKQRKTGGSEDE
ncbi:MAG: PilZ domain-containing protein [Clostridiales bacterium]|jgi:c-di-GMP-binding flagellar brake protein YcgR|nr:PilZ domain-containing protein [Clostridiales bacterium]